MTTQTNGMKSNVVNGIDVDEYKNIVESVKADHELAKFQFRARNLYDSGGYNRTIIKGFYGAGEEQGATDRNFVVAADEPPVLLGTDQAPNPVEYLLHALASCLTSSIIYKATIRGITIDTIESTIEGDMDARSFLEISDEQRRGYQQIRVNFKVASDASAEELKACAEFSPVLDVVTRGTSVSLQVEKV